MVERIAAGDVEHPEIFAWLIDARRMSGLSRVRRLSG